MTLTVVTPPLPLLALPDVKTYLRVDHDEHDALLSDLAGAAVAHLDAPFGWLGRALSPQTLELSLDEFPQGWLPLPFPPLIEVTSITYTAPEKTAVILAPSLYRVAGSAIHLMSCAGWLGGRAGRGAVRVRYKAGFDPLPFPIKAALLMMTADLYAQRETFVVGTISSEVPMSVTVERLLTPYRIW